MLVQGRLRHGLVGQQGPGIQNHKSVKVGIEAKNLAGIACVLAVVGLEEGRSQGQNLVVESDRCQKCITSFHKHGAGIGILDRHSKAAHVVQRN